MAQPNIIQTILGVAACKATRGILRMTHRGGTALPGKVAMRIAPGILERTSAGMEIIVVTGTNGKTTTSRMLEHAITASGRACLSNKSGANLLSGVTAEITCNATWSGKARTHLAVIECDEGALKQVVPLIHPKVIVVTNLFRDQLDRYGEITHTRDAIRIGLDKVPETTVCLNADDSLVSSLAIDLPNKVVWYGMDLPIGEQEDVEISDAKYCIRCGHAYEYRYHTYAHLGHYVCPHCGYERQSTEVAVTRIDAMAANGSQVEMRLGERRVDVTVGLPAVYNLYNAIAAVCGFRSMGLPEEEILQSLADVHSSFGRMETFDLGGVPVQMILVKNPAGCNQALEYVRSLTGDCTVVFCLNDRTADGHDISWIWDADHERIAQDPKVQEILVFGDRAEDMQLRLKYAGASEDRVTLVPTIPELVTRLKASTRPVYVLPNYTSMLALREALKQETGAKDFYE